MTLPRRPPIPALLAAVAAALACAPVPRPPAPEREPEVILTSEDVDRKVGEEAAEEIGGTLGLLEDPELTAYVDGIGQRLARRAPRRRFPYEFRIVDEDAPNAFALPGGFVYVSRGLLILADSEDELANVLAHEVVHVAARHAAARQSVIRGIPIPTFFAIGHVAQYSRDQEREADRLGQGLAALAGYDPQAMASFLRDLEFTERLRLGGSRLPGFFDTHPTTSERTAASGARAQIVAWTPRPGIEEARARHLERIDGLAVGTPASEGVFQGDRFLHADLDFTLRFPDGWETRNTRQAVGAFSPRRDAQVYLELQGEGDDPQAASEEYLEKTLGEGTRIEVREVQPLRLAGSPAYRIQGAARSRDGSAYVTLTWIARGGHVYRLTGAVAGTTSAQKYEGVFLSVARSFRPLPSDLRESIREDRLRVVPARAGETLAELSRRTGNSWDLQTTAVMNDLFADAQLSAGQLVKVAVTEAYETYGATGGSDPATRYALD